MFFQARLAAFRALFRFLMNWVPKTRTPFPGKLPIIFRGFFFYRRQESLFVIECGAEECIRFDHNKIKYNNCHISGCP
jgi:hypothetical protein